MRKTFLLATLVIMVLSVACNPKEQARWIGEEFSYRVGVLPDDVCRDADGAPIVYGASTESRGGYSLVYLRNNGDVVVAQWLTDPVAGVLLSQAGEMYWPGGVCPPMPENFGAETQEGR